MYTGDCCDRSTGANMLASAAYLTFLLAAPLLLLTTAHFIIGESCAELIRYCGYVCIVYTVHNVLIYPLWIIEMIQW